MSKIEYEHDVNLEIIGSKNLDREIAAFLTGVEDENDGYERYSNMFFKSQGLNPDDPDYDESLFADEIREEDIDDGHMSYVGGWYQYRNGNYVKNKGITLTFNNFTLKLTKILEKRIAAFNKEKPLGKIVIKSCEIVKREKLVTETKVKVNV